MIFSTINLNPSAPIPLFLIPYTLYRIPYTTYPIPNNLCLSIYLVQLNAKLELLSI